MAFGNFTLTGTVQRLDGKPALGARVLVYGVPPTVVNTAGDTVRAGLDPVKVDVTGKFTVQLPSNATTGNSTTIGFRVVTQYRNGQTGTPVEFYARPIGSTVDLADITPTGVPEGLGATAANVAAAQAAADRAEAAAANVAWTLVPIQPSARFMRDSVILAANGTIGLTLGATPLPYSDTVTVVTAAGVTRALRPTTDYTLTGKTLTLVTAFGAGDTILIRYAYDSDTQAAPAQATTTQTLLVDNFARADSATSVGTAETGQTWQVAGDSVWGITGGQLYMSQIGTQVDPGTGNARPNDALMINIGRVAYTYTVKVNAWSNGGLCVVANALDYQNQVTTNKNAAFKRVAGNNGAAILTFSQAFVDGDTMRVERASNGTGHTFYRDAGSTGTFVSVGTVTITGFETGTWLGVRSRTDTLFRVDSVRVD